MKQKTACLGLFSLPTAAPQQLALLLPSLPPILYSLAGAALSMTVMTLMLKNT